MVAKKKTVKVAKSAKSAKSSKAEARAAAGAKSAAGAKNAKVAKAAKGAAAKKKKAAVPAPARASSTKKVQRTTPARTASSSKRRNPRLIQNLLLKGPSELEEHFVKVRQEEVVRLFDESYPSDLVNLLLELKRSTCRQLFGVVTEHRKRAYLDTITLYYYKDYLTNPLPLQLDGVQGGGSVPNYYSIVGMARDASEDEIDEASKLLTRAFKPECFAPSDRKMGDLRLNEIKGAFERLRSPKRRNEVNRILPNINYFYPKRADSWLELVQRFAL